MMARSRQVVLITVATVVAITVFVLCLSLLFHPHVGPAIYRRYLVMSALTVIGAGVVGFGLGRFAVAQLELDADREQSRLRLYLNETGHALRTPLAVMRGALVTFRRSVKQYDPTTLTLLDAVDEEIGRLTQTVERLLLLARLDAALRTTATAIELGKVLGELADEARLRDADIALHLELATPINTIDEVAFREAIRNLIDNAIRYAPGSPIRLVASDRSGRLAISVADDGPGMDADDQALACERYYRGQAARDTIGSGLGLAIAKATAENAGGELVIVTAEGRGCEVSLLLPVSVVDPLR